MADLPEQVAAQAAAVDEYDAQVLADQQTPPPDTPPETPPAEPPKPADPPPEDWEQKFKTIKGKYDREVPELRGQVRDLAGTVETLKTQPPKQEAPTEPKPAKLKAEDAATFGDDLIDMVQRAATDVAEQAIGAIRSELEGLKTEVTALKGGVKSVAEMQVADARTQMLSDLTKEFGDLEVLNADERFLNWCQSRVPGTRYTYQQPLTEAFDANDSAQAIELINIWRTSVGLSKPADTAPPAPPADNRTPIEELVQPAKSSASAPPGENVESKIWPVAEVEAFYRDASKGRLPKAEQATIEAQIDRATAEGRVR
jgi:hypothetical protein